MGANDANGVFAYDGSESLDPFHAMLNLLATSISALIAAINAKVIMQLSTATATASGTATTVPYDTSPLVNVGAQFTITPASGTFVCAVAGTYKIEAVVNWASNTTGTRLIQTQKAVAASPSSFSAVDSVQHAAPASAVTAQEQILSYITVAVGDVIRVQSQQSSGGSLNMVSAHIELKKVA